MYKFTLVDNQANFEKLQKLNSKFTDDHATWLIGPRKWGYAILAEDAEQENLLGYSLACLNYSTWKGVNLEIEEIFVKNPSSEAAENLISEIYAENLKFARNCHLTQVRGLIQLSDQTKFLPSTFENVSISEKWDILQLPKNAMVKLSDSVKIQEKSKILTKQGICIAKTTPSDVPGIIQMIEELAIYEYMLSDCWMNHEILENHLLNIENRVNVNLKSKEPVVNMWSVKDGEELIGYCCVIPCFSTHESLEENGAYHGEEEVKRDKKQILGKYLYLEDLYLKEKYRGQGIGINMIQTCVNFGLENGANAMRWACLNG